MVVRPSFYSLRDLFFSYRIKHAFTSLIIHCSVWNLWVSQDAVNPRLGVLDHLDFWQPTPGLPSKPIEPIGQPLEGEWIEERSTRTSPVGISRSSVGL